jgi:glutamine synthetase
MCSRVVLQRAVDRAAALGFTFNLGIETEFYLVRRENGSIVPANALDVLKKAAYDIVDLLANMPFMDEARSRRCSCPSCSGCRTSRSDR